MAPKIQRSTKTMCSASSSPSVIKRSSFILLNNTVLVLVGASSVIPSAWGFASVKNGLVRGSAPLVSSTSFSCPASLPCSGGRSQKQQRFDGGRRERMSSGVLFSSPLSFIESTTETETIVSPLSQPTITGAAASETKTSEYDWSFLDAVYLITCPNADPNSERLNKAMAILSSVGLDQVQVKEFETDDEDRIRGCYNSHVSVMRDALNELGRRRRRSNESGGDWWKKLIPAIADTGMNGYSSPNGSRMVNGNGGAQKTNGSSSSSDGGKVLILEDNLDLSDSTLKQSLIDTISDFTSIGSTNSWDIMHLAYTPYVPNLTITKTPNNRNILKLTCGIGSALGTTAYIINYDAMEAVINEDDVNGFYAPIPDVMSKLFPNSRYASYPIPFIRAPKTQSLVNPQLDDLRFLLFQPKFVSLVQWILPGSGLSTNQLLPLTIVGLLVLTILSGKVTLDAAYDVFTTGTYDGPILIPFLGMLSSIFSLTILGQGIALAPKQPPPK